MGLVAPSGPLVSTDWLAQHLAEPIGAERRSREGHLVVVDIRGKVLPPNAPPPRYLPKRQDYEAAHIPGAVFVDWTVDIVDLDDPIPSQIAPPERFGRQMERLGIGDDTLVVAYDDYDMIFAGRLAWALRYYGHDGVRILDGGWTRWQAEGRASTSEVSPPALAARFTPRAQPDLRRTADQVLPAVERGALLVDARAPAQYEGAVSAASRAGHIPGARNVPYGRLVDAESGRFLPREKLAQVFAEAGIDVAKLPREIVVYCNGGISCSIARTAFELFGRDDAAVYDGSWNEWGNDPRRPLATGKEP
jgi:thiosulfate/3-mercaptopyruvate sulfurtransferase